MIALTAEPIDVAAVDASVRADGAGALVSFVGVVRGTSDDGRRVSGLFYEAYTVPAVEEMRRIAHEAEERFAGVRIAALHRVGDVTVGEPSVAVAASAPHRSAAFDACRYVIDELKQRAPIWKKERYADGDAAWRENAPAAP